ncbi:MAG: hypothetical protein QNL01_13925 [Akkermansiaceae bacterium]|tara:strand:+ start:101 stop:532 length:432 start_codon:yes stop_codon:yes gene_type:complete
MAQRKQIAQAKERKQELAAQLANSRHSISQSREALKGQLQLKKQLRKFVVSKPKAIFAGSVVAGLILTLLLKRPRKSKKSAPKTTSQILLGWGLALAKPAAKAWLVTRAKKIATERVSTLTPLKENPPFSNVSAEIEDETIDW